MSPETTQSAPPGALVLLTFPLAVASNIIRIVTIALGVHYLGVWTLQSVYHTFSGSVNFLFTLLLLFAIDQALVRWTKSRTWSTPRFSTTPETG